MNTFLKFPKKLDLQCKTVKNYLPVIIVHIKYIMDDLSLSYSQMLNKNLSKTSPTLPISPDSKGLLKNYFKTLQSCKQIIRKSPETKCNIQFITDKRKDKSIEQEFCCNHRYCFFPIPSKGRCRELRFSNQNVYCEKHQDSIQPFCNHLVEKYKNICKIDPYKCSKEASLSLKDQETLWKDTLKKQQECTKSRETFNRLCIDSSVQSNGHYVHLAKLYNIIEDCKSLLDELKRVSHPLN